MLKKSYFWLYYLFNISPIYSNITTKFSIGSAKGMDIDFKRLNYPKNYNTIYSLIVKNSHNNINISFHYAPKYSTYMTHGLGLMYPFS